MTEEQESVTEYRVYWKDGTYTYSDLQTALALAKMFTKDDARASNAVIKGIRKGGEIETVLFINWWSRKGLDIWELTGFIC